MPEESRRERLCIQAFDPTTRGPCIVQLSQQRLLTIAKWGSWALKEAQVIVPTVLQHPTAVFEGLRRDKDEDAHGTGWRCYIGHPGCTMKAMTNAEFVAQLAELAKDAGPPQPTAVYDPDGDCIEFLASPEPFYAERVDDLVTVYYSQETKEVIGSLLKGVSRFCENVLQRLPGFRIRIIDGDVRLEYIFLAKLWSAEHDPQDIATLTYEKLIKIAEKTGVKVENAEDLCGAA